MSCFDRVAMSCTIYIVSYNFITHATCSLALALYKYNELEVFGATQKISCKTPLFLIVVASIDKMQEKKHTHVTLRHTHNYRRFEFK
jgi:hypothetical protein